ncbi:dihydrolipoamide acetyltransferase component of pyruvate dehydrogenase complex [Arthrobacter sp. MN05-02]|nr:dihydrolipoamide acetyltransferase component of pyruvate dehydrogenase complex [Arthrobacter sp. MN05-02]
MTATSSTAPSAAASALAVPPTTRSAGTTTGGTTPARVREFRLPDLGEGLTESEIVQWHVTVGDTVELNQIIADVETAKAVVELPSPYAGVVVHLHAAAGSVVDVGAPIVSFEVPEPDGTIPAPASEPAPPSTPPPSAPADVPARREPNLVGYGAAVEKSGRPQRRSRIVPTAGPGPAPVPAGSGPSGSAPSAPGIPSSLRHAQAAPASAAGGAARRSGDRPRSTPPVRKLARDLGIPLDTLTGTRPGALITRTDVLAALAGATESAAAAAGTSAAPAGHPPTAGTTASAGSAGPGETRTPIRGMRKHTAAAMVASAFTAPHVTEFLTIDVTPTMDLLADLRASRAFEATKVTPLTIVAKAVCIAIARNPTLNSSWDEEAQEIVQYGDVNLGIAAATPRGLLVPNIKAAQHLSLADLAKALGSLAETARAGKTPPADLAGGTISITNIGVFGIDAGTPILNPGEAAILALGAVRSMPWEYQGTIALRSVLTLSLSFDHRLVDGEQGSRFLADVGTILRNPAMVLTMV